VGAARVSSLPADGRLTSSRLAGRVLLRWPRGGRRGKDRGQEYRGHQAYEAAHPGTEITYRGPYWRAVITGEGGETVIVRVDLRGLLDQLESLDDSVRDEPQAEGPPG
jgi:hypothetical protein